jgi:hypothetical protein
MRALRSAPVLLALLVATTARASPLVINNGLAPPNPANVISTLLSDDGGVTAQDVHVQNVGCDVTVQSPCASPGAATTVEITVDGVAGQVEVHETSSILMSGGTLWGDLQARDDSIILMSGGDLVSGSLVARDGAEVTFAGGYVTESLVALDVATLFVTGGLHSPGLGQSVGSLGGTAFISGGSFIGSSVRADNGGFVEMSGGSLGFGTDFVSYGAGSVLRIRGSGFEVNGSPVGPGAIALSSGQLSGTFESGDSFGATPFTQVLGGSIVLVPEPSTGGLLTAGLGLLAAGRRRASASDRRRIGVPYSSPR